MAVVAVMGATGEVSAQVLANDPSGYPIRVIPRYLFAGTTYQFSTDWTLSSVPGSTPDSVLSLLKQGQNLAVAGADGCNTSSGWDWYPSCFSYTPSSSGWYSLILYAYQTISPGVTTVWQRTGTGGWGNISAGDVTFGGGVGYTNFTLSQRVYLQSQLRPGQNAYHVILSAEPNHWRIRRWNEANGRVGDTAMIWLSTASSGDQVGSRVQVVGTVFAAQAGPVKLLQNHFFSSDWDADGLSGPLENALGTCDYTTPVWGFDCGTLPGCDEGPYDPLCVDSLRDTDHDGLRDDLEVFGYDHALLHLSRWGADPRHMDVFIEMDVFDQDETTPSTCSGGTCTDCEGFDWVPGGMLAALGQTSPDNQPFDRIEEVYEQAPGYVNPDGQLGINVHFDVGVANPDPFDTRWGDWGGGGTCVPLDCGEGEYDYERAFNGECGLTAIETMRKWVFLYGVDRPGSGGQTGGPPGNRNMYTAASAVTHAHEIGHMGWLNHGGPIGSTGDGSNQPIGQPTANFRRNYRSRINYYYQNVGSWAAAIGWWDDVSFSHGGWVTPMSTRIAPETCPAGPSEDLAALEALGVAGGAAEWVVDNPTGCDHVDWNQSGTPTSPDIQGVPTWNRARANYDRHARWRYTFGPASPSIWRETPSSAVIDGAHLVTAHIERGGGPAGGDYPRVVFRADTDGDCNIYPFDPRETEWRYPPCFYDDWIFRPPSPLGPTFDFYAQAVAVASAPVMAGSVQREGAVVVWHVGSAFGEPTPHLEWATVTVEPHPTYIWPSMTMNWQPKGIIPGTDGTVSTAADELELVRVPGTDEVLLFFEDLAGVQRQVSLPPLAESWSPINDTGFDSDQPVAATTTADGRLLAVSYDASLGYMYLREWSPAVPASEGTWPAPALAFDVCMSSKPAIVDHPDLDEPLLTRTTVFYRECIGNLYTMKMIQRSLTSPVNFEPPMQWNAEANHHRGTGGLEAIYDARAGIDQGVRGIRLHHRSMVGCYDEDEEQQVCSESDQCAGFPALLTLKGCSTTSSVNDFYTLPLFTPFALGDDPSMYADYDDWRTMQWGYCESVASQSWHAPDGYSAFNYTSYRDWTRCGPMPRHLEPTPGGMAYTAFPDVGNEDRTLYPWLYVGGQVTCEGP
jgi:hypothetical protein